MFSKTLPFWIIKNWHVWYLNLHERYRFPPEQKMFLTTIISFLYNVFKNLHFLDRQNSELFDTQTYTRGIDFLHSKKCFNPPFSPSSTMFSKTSPFWIVKTQDCLVLKLTGEVSISSLAKKATSLICRYGVYGHRLVFNRIERL